MPPGPIVSYEHLGVAYGTIRALRDVSFRVPAGSVFAVLGPNGAGKTTLAKATVGLMRPYRGRILYQGADIAGTATSRLVRAGIGVVPEGRELFSRLTVRENLQLGARGGRGADRMEEVVDLFPVLGGRSNQVAGTLSGGEQQMLAIGRALMADPAVLILDEPSAGLAPAIVRDLVDQLARITERGKTLMLIEQNVRVALQLADHAAVLSSGVLVATGTPEEIGRKERIAGLYFGRSPNSSGQPADSPRRSRESPT